MAVESCRLGPWRPCVCKGSSAIEHRPSCWKSQALGLRKSECLIMGPERKRTFSSCSDATETRGKVTQRSTAFVHIRRWTHPLLFGRKKDRVKPKCVFGGGTFSCSTKKNGITKVLRFNCKDMDSTGCLLCFFDHRCLLLDWFVDRVLWRAKKQNAREGAFFTTQSKGSTHHPFKWSTGNLAGPCWWTVKGQGIIWKFKHEDPLYPVSFSWTKESHHDMVHRIASCSHSSRCWPSRADWMVRPIRWMRKMDKRKISREWTRLCLLWMGGSIENDVLRHLALYTAFHPA